MFNFNINPEILSIGPVSIRYYGIIYALGFIITLFYLNYLRKKNRLELSKDDVYDLILYLVIGVVLGARIFEVMVWSPGYYFSNPGQIIAIWNGGLSFHGGLIGAALACYLFSKKHKLSFLKLADAIIVPGTLALALGRIGNFLNGELYGTVTNLSWCVNFPDALGCRHPYQIYASLGHFASLFILLMVNKKEHKQGFIFWMGILLFGMFRLILDFWREDARWLGLSLGQYLSIPLILIAGYVLLRHYKSQFYSS